MGLSAGITSSPEPSSSYARGESAEKESEPFLFGTMASGGRIAEMMVPFESKSQTYGPYSSPTQNVPSSLMTRPSLSTEMRLVVIPLVVLAPKPSPVYVAAGSCGKPSYSRPPEPSASRPVVGCPSGPLKSIVST